MSIHDVATTLLIGFVLAIPFIAVGLQRRTLLGPPGSMVELERILVLPIATLSLGAGLIHLAVIDEHFRADPISGLFFVVAAVFQLSWAVLFGRRPQRAVHLVGGVGNAAIIVVWLLTRTLGLPFGEHAGIAEPIGVADLFATLFELGIVATTLALVLARRGRAIDRPSFPVASADLGLAMALLAITLVTSYALVDISITGGHGHEATEGSTGPAQP